MPKVCFVSFEIFPTTRGGCGTLLHNAARVLLARGHEVVFVLDMPLDYFERFRDTDRLALPNAERCHVYHVDTLCAGLAIQPDDFMTAPQWRSWRFHVACADVAARETPDVIEFFDYCGVAHYALAAKVAGLAYHDSLLAIRLHSSVELMDSFAPPKRLDLERHGYYALEHNALQMAEVVLYPSQSYLTKTYQPRYEPWLGKQVCSKPPLVDVPEHAGVQPDADVILFYGRLFAFKGVDRFIHAAVALLSERPTARIRFVLAGHDSYEAPDGSPSYQEYLRRKIPAGQQGRFSFTDHLSWQELTALLPSVLFAVFPSYLEAFGYAAHELYAAGVPIIVSDIPDFEDYFRHEVNALVFDGTTGDLSRQMARLCDDPRLRGRITKPFAVANDSLGDFYERPVRSTWMMPTGKADRPSLLAIVIADRAEADLRVTLDTLKGVAGRRIRIVVLEPAHSCANDAGAMWLWGRLFVGRTHEGDPIPPTVLATDEALVIFRAGDRPTSEFLHRSLDTLARQPEIAFVSSWKECEDQDSIRLDTFPLDAALELAPFLGASPFSRSLMRTEPGRLLIDLFEPQAGIFGEIMYLWKLEASGGRGLVIPAALVRQREEPVRELDLKTFAYLAMQDSSPWRRSRLARYLVAVWSSFDQATRLRNAHRVGDRTGQNGVDDRSAAASRPRTADELDGRTLLRMALRRLLKKVRAVGLRAPSQ